jgi:hypothetical protein
MKSKPRRKDVSVKPLEVGVLTMDDKQFEDMQRRGAVQWVDPKEGRKKNARLWGWSVTVGLGVGIAATIYYNSGITGICGGIVGFIVAFAVICSNDEKPHNPFPT